MRRILFALFETGFKFRFEDVQAFFVGVALAVPLIFLFFPSQFFVRQQFVELGFFGI